MENKKMLVVCTSGLTTGLLVRSIQQNIDRQNLSIHVSSAPAIIAEKIIEEEQIDCILLGPQVKYELNRLEDLLTFKKIPYKLIDEKDYELLDGKRVLEEGMKLMKM